MTQEEMELIFKLYEEKMELRKIARALERSLSSIQYQLRKKMKMYKEFLAMLRKSPIVFSYLYLNELYTFYKKKDNRVYIWSAVGVTKTRRKFYFYFLSKKKNINSLLSFNFNLPKVEKYYTDGHFAYSKAHAKSF